jgi:hypothetical protein
MRHGDRRDVAAIEVNKTGKLRQFAQVHMSNEQRSELAERGCRDGEV